MPSPRPCMSCGAPLDSNGDCHTRHCPYNPDDENVEFDAEVEEETYEHKGGEPDNEGDEEGPSLEDFGFEFDDPSEADEPLFGESEQEDKKNPITDDDRAPDESGGKKRDSEDQLSDTQQGESQKEDTKDTEGKDPAEEINDERDFDQPPGKEEDDLSQEDLEELANEGKPKDLPGDEEGDDDLPERPPGCQGNCQPNDDPSEGDDPCPHCTAKNFKEQMEEEGKEQQPEEQMEEDWQKFLDEWEQKAQKDGNGQGEQDDLRDLPEDDEDQLNQEGKQNRDDDDRGHGEGEGEQDPEADWICPEDGHANDHDAVTCEECGLPRPQGPCKGDCKPGDGGEDQDPCPHCTAKQFQEQMKEQKEQKGDDLSEEEIGQMFEDFLKDWNEKAKQEQEQQSERDEIIAAVNQAREDFSVNVFERLDAWSDDKLAETFSAEELSDFGDVAENNNAHKEAAHLRAVAEKMGEPKDEDPPEDEMQDGEQKDDDEKKDDEPPKDFKRVAEDLTITQEKRFDNLVNRIAPKVGQTFGKTMEDFRVGAKTEGQFAGEDLSQTITIISRGVVYYVTVSAAKNIE